MKPLKYLREVRSELAKVTWPNRKETTVSTIMVFIMVAIVAIFLYFSDQVIAWLIHMILS